MAYPSTITAFTTKNPGDVIDPAHINTLQTEITALETGLLGTGGLQHPLVASQAFTAMQAVTLSGIVTPPSISTQQDDYNPAGFAQAFMMRQALGANATITGFAAQPSGRLVAVANLSTFVLTLANLGATSAAANRILCPGAVDLALPTNAVATLWYDITNALWRVVGVALPPASGSASSEPGALCYHNTTQALGAGAWTTLAFNSEEYDSGTLHDLVTNNSRITVPTQTGARRWLVRAGCYYGVSTGNVKLRLKKNGATLVNTQTATITGAGAAGNALQSTAILNLVQGDYVEAEAWSSAANTAGDAADRSQQHELQAVRLI